jgi:hypothetical protein
MEVKRVGSRAQAKVEKRTNVAVATFCMGLKLLNRRRNRRMGGTDLSNDICALLAIRLGSIIIDLRLPHAANGRFKPMISYDPVPGFGRDGVPRI